MSTEESGWRTQTGYIFSLIGSAVGFANILSFSAQAYKNGGGAFLIPYFFALLLIGIPFLLLEGLVGSRFKTTLVGAYGKLLGEKGKVLGWISIFTCLTIGGFYTVLTGYAAAYTFFAASNSFPEDTKSFFLHNFLKISPSLAEFGEFSYIAFFAALFVMTLTFFVMIKNIQQGVERISTFFMPALALIMFLFAVWTFFLPNGVQGWLFYLTPDFQKLKDVSLWKDIFGQLFFSLSLGLGIIVGYSRHTKKKINLIKSMIYVALGDFLVSFVAGGAIFGILSHVATVKGVSFDSILRSDSTFEIGFILFPEILKTFGSTLSVIIGSLFFSSVFIAGITGVFSIIESIAGNIEVEFKITRKKAVFVTLILTAILSLFFSMGNASHLIDALAPMVLGTNMLISELLLVITFFTLSKELKEDIIWSNSYSYFGPFFKTILLYGSPVLLSIILVFSVFSEIRAFDMALGVRLIWGLVLVLASFLITKLSPSRSQVISSI